MSEKPIRRKMATHILEKAPEPEVKRPREYLSDAITHRYFMMTLLIIAVVDALFAATSLTADILAIQSARETVCNTREVLTILYDEHRGNMDDWFESHTADELLEEVRDRGGPTLLSRLSRDINPDVIEVRPGEGGYTTHPNYDRDSGSSQADTDMTDHAHKDTISSSDLFLISQAFRYASLILVCIMFIIKMVRIYALKCKFFKSKLQTIDLVVILLSLPLDILFLPTVYRHTDAYRTAIPIIYDVTSRVARVVINCLINLHQKDKILLAQEKSKLKASQKKNKFGKTQAKHLRELAKNLGAEEADVLACSKVAKKKKRYLKKNSLLSALLSAHQILFIASPNAPIVPNMEVEVSLDKPFEIPTIQEDEDDSITPLPKKRAYRIGSKESSVGSLGSGLSSYDSDDDDDSTSDEMLDSGSSDTEDDLDSERGRGKISDATIITYM